MRSDSVKNMSACADQNYASSLMDVRLEKMGNSKKFPISQKAYSLLEQQGFIYPVKGRGNFVSGNQALVEQRKNVFLQKLKILIKEGKEIGISKEECAEKTAEFYEEVKV